MAIDNEGDLCYFMDITLEKRDSKSTEEGAFMRRSAMTMMRMCMRSGRMGTFFAADLSDMLSVKGFKRCAA